MNMLLILKASSVQFIHFKFTDNQVKKFKLNSSQIEIGINHKEYSHSTKLSENTIKSLSTDFTYFSLQTLSVLIQPLNLFDLTLHQLFSQFNKTKTLPF